jgi:hypothetical protein
MVSPSVVTTVGAPIGVLQLLLVRDGTGKTPDADELVGARVVVGILRIKLITVSLSPRAASQDWKLVVWAAAASASLSGVESAGPKAGLVLEAAEELGTGLRGPDTRSRSRNGVESVTFERIASIGF